MAAGVAAIGTAMTMTGGAMIGGGTRDRTDVDAVKAAHDVVDVAQRYTRLRRAGRTWTGLSPIKPERTPSFHVYPHNQSWYCFASGVGGDVIRLVALCEGIDDGHAIQRLRADAGLDSGDPERRRQRERDLAAARARREAEAAKADAARREAMGRFAAAAVTASRAAAGSVVETYLRSRHIDLDALRSVYGWDGAMPASLRLANLDYRTRPDGEAPVVVHAGPAMIGIIGPTPEAAAAVLAGAPARGCHRTWLRPDGSGKAHIEHRGETLPAKLTLGDVWGSAGWLTGGDGIEDGVVGEGYETTLTVVGALAAAGRRVVSCSALSLGNLAGKGMGQGPPHPQRPGHLPSAEPRMDAPGIVLPAQVRRWTILADADGRDPLSTAAMVRRAAARWRRQGLAVRIAWPEAGTDFNDMAAQGATARHLMARIEDVVAT